MKGPPGRTRGAREILKQSRPRMTRPEYLAFQRGLEERRVYDESTSQSSAR